MSQLIDLTLLAQQRNSLSPLYILAFAGLVFLILLFLIFGIIFSTLR